MSITCSCDYDYDPDGSAFYYDTGSGIKPLDTAKSRKCVSCKTKLKPGEPVEVITRWRQSKSDIEERIHGYEVLLAPWFFCPHCAALAEIVSNRGGCYEFTESMQNQLIERITDGEPCSDGQDPAAALLFDLFSKFAQVAKYESKARRRAAVGAA